MKYTKKQIEESIAHWETVLEEMGSLEEVGADDILNMWKKKQDAEGKSSSAAIKTKDQSSAQDTEPGKFTSYVMGNDTHDLYAGDWIIGMYMQKTDQYASYAIYRMSKLTAHKFKSLKGKTQTSTLKSFLTREAELIEKDERGTWTLDKFIEEMKRLVGPAHFGRQPVMFTAGLNRTYYHYGRNARHRGKTTMTTQKNGHITYDLDDFKFDGATFDVASGRSKQHQMSFGGASGKLPRQQADHSYEEIQEAIAHWTKVLESMNETEYAVVRGKKLCTDGAIVDNGINWITFWFDDEDSALAWYQREFGIDYDKDLLIKPTKRDTPGEYDDKFGISMHK